KVESKDGVPEDIDELKQRLDRDDVKSERKKVLKEWTSLESNNKVIPVRIPQRDFLMKYLKSIDGSFPKSRHLIPIEDIQIPVDKPIVVVAVSGGGIRSAAWAYIVLQELELYFAKHNIDLSRHLRVVTGASGGMLGASYYVSLLTENANERLSFPL